MKFKKIINYIDMMLLVFILIASTIFVRNTEIYKQIQISINILMIIYLVIRILKKKPINIIKSKLDVFVILLVFSTSIPLLFNTYISFQTSVTSILSYITIFWIYLLTREIAQKSNKNIQIISSCIIFITILLIIVGIENLTTNKIFSFFNINYIINGESRLVSIFGNPNIFAGLIVFSYFLSTNKIINYTNLKRIFFSIINTLLILGLALTYSKAMFIIFLFTLLIYMFTIKNKENNIYIFQNTILSILMAVIYIFIFQKYINQQNYILILIFSILWIVFAILLNILNTKITKYIQKIKIKNIIIISCIFIIGISVWTSFELQNSKEFVVFNKNSNADYNSKKINNIKPNEKYTFSFDIFADIGLIKNDSEQDIFTINIIQRDKRNVDITNTEEKFGKFSGVKDISIETSENTSEIKIEFKSKYSSVPKEWIIKSLKINGVEKILEYKHLPTKLVEKIKDINIGYKTAQERFQFIKDGFKLISKNFLTGIGGNGWQLKYQEVQDYGYITNDTHSYFIQIWLEYGLLGIISFLAIIYYIIKCKDTNLKGVKFATMALLLHSIIDSEMYHAHFRLILFMALGLLSVNYIGNKSLEKNYKRTYISNIFLIFIAISTIYLYLHPKVYNKNLALEEIKKSEIGLYINSQEYKQLNFEKIQAYNDIIKHEKDIYQRHVYEIKKMEAYINSGQDKLEEFANEYYNYVVNFHNNCLYNNEKIVLKSNSIVKANNILQAQNDPKLYPLIIKLCEININEFETTKSLFEFSIKRKLEYTEETRAYNELLNNYQETLNTYKRYFLGINIQNLSDVDLEQTISNTDIQIDNPKDIIIYHTHTTEAYLPDNENLQEEIVDYSLDPNYNVLEIGKTMKEALTDKGFNVLHIQNYHNLQGNDGAYQNSMATIKNLLEKQNKNIDLIFDIHRDSYLSNFLNKNCVEIDGQKVANIRIIVSAGHEGWENNLKWAVEIQKKADELYPNLFNPLYIYNGVYNQSLSKYAILIEVGNNGNTIEESKRSILYFSDIIDRVINNK